MLEELQSLKLNKDYTFANFWLDYCSDMKKLSAQATLQHSLTRTTVENTNYNN